MNSSKTAVRTFGIAFFISYMSYGLGFGLSNSVWPKTPFSSLCQKNNFSFTP